MKVLLLNPPGAFCRAGSRWPHSRKRGAVGIDYHPFPFQLAYATSRLQADGHEARFIDCIALGVTPEELAREAEAFQPDIVFMETSAPSWANDLDTLGLFRCPVMAGGAHATATIAEHLAAGFAAVIQGEYDQYISQAVVMDAQPWLATREHAATAFTPLVRDLDAIPRPPWEQLAMEKYNDPFCKGRSVTVLTSRGCPLECGFCTIAPFEGKRNYRRREPEQVCDEVRELIARYQPDEIYFDDDTITINRKHMLALCDVIKARRFGIPFSCMGNAVIERDVIIAMAEAGCRAIKFGVESADPEVLRQIPKDQKPEDVARTVRDCNEFGIRTHANFLLGLPGETRESALRTIDFALNLGTHTLQFAIATPYPGTAFYDTAKREGWLTKESWMQFDPSREAVVSYPGYSAEDIAAMYELAWSRWQWHMLTHRPRTLLHHFGNAFRRGGLTGVARLGRYSAQRFLKVVGAQ